ncbi:MAG: alpha/beta hydrolase family protein [Brachymonas sp.]
MPLILTASLCATHHASAQIGMREVMLGKVATTLVYPTPEKTKPLTRGPFTVDVALDAPALEQRQRLIIMSHGSGGSAIADHALAAALAKAGFVVVQPLHQGDNYMDARDAGPVSFERRPSEIIQVLNALGQDSYWANRLDLSKVGVHGMSAGGVTGLTLAGAQWRTLNVVRHCGEYEKEDEGFCFNGAKEGAARSTREASFKRAQGVPEVFLPSDLKLVKGGRDISATQPDPRQDARIASVSLMVPLAAIFSEESLARIQIPVAVVSAQQDLVLLPRFHSDRVLRHVKTSVQLAKLPGGHFDVLWPWPESVAKDVAAQQVRGGMPTPGFDAALRESAHEQIVKFHRQHLAR